ncbi:MAG TPA: MFS transporter [Acetobacteraceae bacterium]|jgi:MFS family permease|nr:MFS transporter [Acetobacteraceae bacterium]
MANGRGATAIAVDGWRGVSRYQWFVFLVVWLGWTLDSADFGLYALVIRPALTELLGGNPPLAQIGRVGGLLSMAGLLGWAFGGFLFGILADYIGRVRALTFSILLYSVFTALQGVSHGIWDFATYRFIAGLGTGAELMVGIPLLAEVLGETHRAKIAGCMMTGGALGTFLGAWAYGFVGGYGWRTVFFIGVVPALLVGFMRRRMMEPERFEAVRERRQAVSTGRSTADNDHEFMRFVPLQLFAPEHLRNTVVGMLFGLGSLLAIWTSNIWLPTILSLMIQKSGVTGAAAVPFVSAGMMVWSIGGIAGYICFGFVADWLGRRATITLYSIGTIAAGLTLYLGLDTYYPWYPYVLPVFGFFVFGTFSGFAIYLPELFPTHLRATAVGFCTGSARTITSFGPLVAGLMVGAFGGSFNKVTALMTCCAVFSIIAMLLGRETKGAGLPR